MHYNGLGDLPYRKAGWGGACKSKRQQVPTTEHKCGIPFHVDQAGHFIFYEICQELLCAEVVVFVFVCLFLLVFMYKGLFFLSLVSVFY